jgi:Holliday junction resolvase RusA-like endonuclease
MPIPGAILPDSLIQLREEGRKYRERYGKGFISIHAAKYKQRVLSPLQKLVPGRMIGVPIRLILSTISFRNRNASAIFATDVFEHRTSSSDKDNS